MLHKKTFSGSFYEQNSQSKTLSDRAGKRKFLMSSFGLLGALPLFQLFRAGRHQAPYFFIASLRGGHISELDTSNFRNTEMLNVLDNKMLKEKKILKTQSVSSQNKTSWLYVFDSKKSRWEWGNEILKYRMFSTDKLAHNLHFFQEEGCLPS